MKPVQTKHTLPEPIQTIPPSFSQKSELALLSSIVILNFSDSKEWSYGHGVLAWPDTRYVLTVGHNFTHASRKKRFVQQPLFPQEPDIGIYAVARSQFYDIGVAKLKKPLVGTPINLNPTPINTFAQSALITTINGSSAQARVNNVAAKNYDFVVRWATMIGTDYVHFQNPPNPDTPLVSFLINAFPGMSGAPYFSPAGELISLHSGGMNNGLLTFGHHIKDIVNEAEILKNRLSNS